MMRVFVKKVWKPYASECNGQSVVLSDDYACHRTVELEDSLKQMNTMRVIIPPITRQLYIHAMLA